MKIELTGGYENAMRETWAIKDQLSLEISELKPGEYSTFIDKNLGDLKKRFEGRFVSPTMTEAQK